MGRTINAARNEMGAAVEGNRFSTNLKTDTGSFKSLEIPKVG